MCVLSVHPGTGQLANPHAFPPWGAITTAATLLADVIDSDLGDRSGRDISAAVCRNLGEHQPVEDKCVVFRREFDDGFVIRSSIGVGWPGETDEDVADASDLLGALPEMKIHAFRYTPLQHAPLTEVCIRAGGSGPSIEEWPFFGSRNASSLPDEVHETAWESPVAVQDERRGLVSVGSDLVSRSEHNRADSQSRPPWAAGE